MPNLLYPMRSHVSSHCAGVVSKHQRCFRKHRELFQHLLRYHLQAAEAPQRGNLLSGYPDGILPGARDAGCRRGRQNDHSAPGRSGRLNAPPGKTPFPQKGNSTKKGTLFRQKLTLLPNGSLKEIFFTTERSAP